jgi:hypothetical protein
VPLVRQIYAIEYVSCMKENVKALMSQFVTGSTFPAVIYRVNLAFYGNMATLAGFVPQG